MNLRMTSQNGRLCLGGSAAVTRLMEDFHSGQDDDRRTNFPDAVHVHRYPRGYLSRVTLYSIRQATTALTKLQRTARAQRGLSVMTSAKNMMFVTLTMSMSCRVMSCRVSRMSCLWSAESSYIPFTRLIVSAKTSRTLACAEPQLENPLKEYAMSVPIYRTYASQPNPVCSRYILSFLCAHLVCKLAL